MNVSLLIHSRLCRMRSYALEYRFWKQQEDSEQSREKQCHALYMSLHERTQAREVIPKLYDGTTNQTKTKKTYEQTQS